MDLGTPFLDGGDAVRVDDRVRDRAVLDDAAIDEDVLRPARRPLLRQRGDEADNFHLAAVPAHVNQVPTLAVELIQPIPQARHRRALQHLAARAREREPDFRVAERELRDHA